MVGRPSRSRRMFCAAQTPDCWATEPSWGSGGAVGRRDVGDVADGVHPGEAVDGELGLYVDPAAATGRGPGALSDGRPGLAAAPHDGPGREARPVVELDPVGVHGCHTGAEPDRRPGRRQLLEGVVVRLLLEGAEQHVAAVDQGDVPEVRRRARLRPGGHQLGEGAGRLDPGRSAADDHDVEGAVTLARGRARGSGLHLLLEMEAEPLGVRHRVQREGVLVGSRDAEEVRTRAGGHHDVGAGEGPPVGEGAGSGRPARRCRRAR